MINKTNNDGRNAIYLASLGYHKEIVQILIDEGFEIDIKKTNKYGQNALNLAS